MRDVCFSVDESCEHCMKELQKLRRLEGTRKPNRYAGVNLKTNRVHRAKVILVPDYNAYGFVTHWHIKKVVL